ncbi:uncharacterized protein LOC143537636 [Bidens hawaiensis]|uniref:uncharacterized protein LOC143537636 n=1 Tax=Bidens hawaiensis TaxID=980011 RepID=UPI0040499673
MNANQNFDQIWGFRRNGDSSSDESKSKSNSEVGTGQEKVNLVPNLVSPKHDRVSETENQQAQVEKKPKRARNTPKKEKKTKKEVKTKVTKPKKDSCASTNIKKKGNNNTRKKKSKVISQMAGFDDFRIFTKSVVDDLRVARETMFAKMRKEMDQLVNSKPRSISKKQKVSGTNATKKPTQKPRARKPPKTKQKTEPPVSKGLDRPQEHVENEKPIDHSSKNPILTDSCPKKPILTESCPKKPIFTNAPGQIITSSYLTLPLVSPNDKKNPILIDPCAKKPIFTNAPDQIATSSYLTLPLVLPNDTSLKQRGNFSALQAEERLRSYVHNMAEPSCVGNVYPMGLNHHQRFDNSNSFGIPNGRVQDFQHDANLLGARMINGGLRYSSGLSGHNIPSHLASNGFRNLYPN